LSKHPDFDRLDEVGTYHVFAQEARFEILNNPNRVLWLIPRKVAIFFIPVSWMGVDYVYWAALPFFPLGLISLLLTREKRHLLAVTFFPVLCGLLVNIVAYADVRHREPFNPLILLVSGWGFWVLFLKCQSAWRRLQSERLT
jgi:hypothetical protein